MVKVLIAADNENYCLLLVNYVIKCYENLKVVGIVTNGKKAVATIEGTKPDVILLYIRMTYLSVIEIMEYLKNVEYYSPQIVFISGDAERIKRFKEIKTAHRLVKKSTSFESMLDTIMNIVLSIEDGRKKDTIDGFLRKLNFCNTNVGYKYINASIYLAYIEPELLDNLERKLYNKVAQMFEVTPMKVKWNIQKAINSTWRYSDEKIICEILDIKDGRKPTAKYIIEKLSSKIN